MAQFLWFYFRDARLIRWQWGPPPAKATQAFLREFKERDGFLVD
jgi:hypothetical protein